MNPSDHERNDLRNGAPAGAHGPTHTNGGPGDGRWLRSVLEHSTEVVKIVAPDGTLRYASPAFGLIFGHDPEEAVGTNVLDYVHPDDLARVLEETEKALSGDGVGRSVAEYRFRHKDGSWRWVESVGTYLLDDPDVGGVVVTVRDVTERKRTEEALKESEERHRIQSRELSLLHHVRSALTQALALPTVFCEVVEAVAETYGYTQVSAYMLEGEDLLLQHQVGYERVIERIPLTEGVSGRTVRTGRPVLLEDVRSDPGFLGAIEGITSEICVPLFDEGQAVGCFNVESTGGVKLTQKDLELMVALGEHASVAVSRARLHTRVKDSEEHFRALTQNSSDLITLLSAVGTIRYQSPAMERILGYRPEERIGDNAFDYIHPNDRERAEMAFAEGLVAPERRPSVEYRFRHKDGRWVWLESVGSNLLDDPGVGEYVVNSRDITGRKEAEEALKESEERYRNLVEQIPAVTYIDRADGSDTPLYTSPQIEGMLGYAPEEWRENRLWEKRLHPDDRDRILAADERLEVGGEPFSEEYRLLARDGSVVWAHEEAVLIKDGEGEPLYWQGVIHDVTERREAGEALKESEERFRSTFEDAPIGVALVGLPSSSPDSDRRYLRVNRALCEMLGYSEEELLSKTSSDVTHPEDLEKSRARADRLLEEGGSKYTLEKRYVRSDGRAVWAMLNTSLVRDPEGNPSHFVSQFQDVTERKETEQALHKGEAFLAESQRIAHLGTWEWDVVTGEVWWSDETYRIQGFEPGEGINLREKVEEAFFPEDLPNYRKKIDEALSGEAEGYDHEHRIRRPDGEMRWVHGQAEVVRGEEGEPLRMIGTVHDVTERKVLEDRLRHQAFHDALTGLPNRQLFVDRLGQALVRTGRRPKHKVGVLFMDLDGFKVVNDSLGHEAGDRLLVAVAERLKGCFRPEDTLARFGGDEFIVLLEEVGGPGDALRVTRRITEGFRGPFVLDGREMFVRLSIGVAVGDAHTGSPEKLLRDADTAMYRAKDEAADYRVFDPAMHERAFKRMELEGYLRHALEKEEFTVYYQPKFRLGQPDRIEEVEALVRWEHPQRGLMLPDDFIPLAEETGLIVPIGGWVTKEACRQVKEWQERYPSEPPLGVSVNLSAGQVRHPGLLREMRSALRESGLEPGSLILEITEGTLLKDTELIETVFGGLKALGVRLDIDDFGKEYSSLSYLNRLPVDGLKIDRLFLESFAENPSNMIIVEAVISLAHSLGLEVTGEGVESVEQLELLRRMGCDFAQGYHLAMPLPGEEIEPLLADLNRETGTINGSDRV